MDQIRLIENDCSYSIKSLHRHLSREFWNLRQSFDPTFQIPAHWLNASYALFGLFSNRRDPTLRFEAIGRSFADVFIITHQYPYTRNINAGIDQTFFGNYPPEFYNLKVEDILALLTEIEDEENPVIAKNIVNRFNYYMTIFSDGAYNSDRDPLPAKELKKNAIKLYFQLIKGIVPDALRGINILDDVTALLLQPQDI